MSMWSKQPKTDVRTRSVTSNSILIPNIKVEVLLYLRVDRESTKPMFRAKFSHTAEPRRTIPCQFPYVHTCVRGASVLTIILASSIQLSASSVSYYLFIYLRN